MSVVDEQIVVVRPCRSCGCVCGGDGWLADWDHLVRQLAYDGSVRRGTLPKSYVYGVLAERMGMKRGTLERRVQRAVERGEWSW